MGQLPTLSVGGGGVLVFISFIFWCLPVVKRSVPQMGLSMTETQIHLNEWYETFLDIYPEESRQRVESGRKLLHRYAPDDDTLKQIFDWVCDWNRYRSSVHKSNKKDKFVPRLPNLFTFFQDSRWSDPLPSTSNLLLDSGETKPPQACTTPGCQDRGVAMADKKLVCARCYTKLTHPNFAATMKETLKAMGFTRGKDEPWRAASMRCIRDNGLINQVPRTLLTEDDW